MKRTKSTIPKKIRIDISQDPFYYRCALRGWHDHVCGGRITREHAIRVSGKNIQSLWAIVPICAKGHDVDQFQDGHSMNKELNEWVALCRATARDILDLFGEKFENPMGKSKILFDRRRYLTGKYGMWNCQNDSIIDYKPFVY